jgi:hypothetical protein
MAQVVSAKQRRAIAASVAAASVAYPPSVNRGNTGTPCRGSRGIRSSDACARFTRLSVTTGMVRRRGDL